MSIFYPEDIRRKRLKTAVLALLLIVPAAVTGGELELFTTDGCSVFPDGTPDQQSAWLGCCVRHDLAYWKGGTYDERLKADEALKTCVEKIGEPEIAAIMRAGVRIGGTPYLPTSFRWGYGWSGARGYKPLSKEEKQEVKRKLELLKSMLDSLSEALE